MKNTLIQKNGKTKYYLSDENNTLEFIFILRNLKKKIIYEQQKHSSRDIRKIVAYDIINEEFEFFNKIGYEYHNVFTYKDGSEFVSSYGYVKI